MDVIILQLATISPKTRFGWIFGTKIKMGLKGIVEENAVGYAFIDADIKRDATLKRILVPRKRIGIRIPVF
jgi:hypothetical protein